MLRAVLAPPSLRTAEIRPTIGSYEVSPSGIVDFGATSRGSFVPAREEMPAGGFRPLPGFFYILPNCGTPDGAEIGYNLSDWSDRVLREPLLVLHMRPSFIADHFSML